MFWYILYLMILNFGFKMYKTIQSQKLHSSTTDPFTKNMPRPDTYITNSRGHKIYYRVLLPKGDIHNIHATVFFSHGVGCHSNRLSYKWFAE